MQFLLSLLLFPLLRALGSESQGEEGLNSSQQPPSFAWPLSQFQTVSSAEAPEPAGKSVQLRRLDNLGWQPTPNTTVGGDAWCRAEVPDDNWSLEGCGTGAKRIRIKVLTYNLFWWNLFRLRKGDGGRSGRLVASTGWPNPFDFMAFQECEDVQRVLRDGGLQKQYGTIEGPYAVALAYRLAAWKHLSDGKADVAEDRADQFYGLRAVLWARFRHRETNRTVFILNHHGPLPVGTGGKCGGSATAFNILKLIGLNADKKDAVLVAGDFNAGSQAHAIQQLHKRLSLVFTGRAMGGVDHIFGCPGSVPHGNFNLGSGGSDHDALASVIEV